MRRKKRCPSSGPSRPTWRQPSGSIAQSASASPIAALPSLLSTQAPSVSRSRENAASSTGAPSRSASLGALRASAPSAWRRKWASRIES